MSVAWEDPRSGEFIAAIKAEADRGCVLLATAYIDGALDSLLRAKLKKMSGTRDKELDVLFKNGPNPPLRSFSVRVRLASAMGLITPRTTKVLQRLAEIRNEFAHQTGPVEISDKRITSLLNELDDETKSLASEIADQFAGSLARLRRIADALPTTGHLRINVTSVARKKFEVATAYIFSLIRGSEHYLDQFVV